MSTDKVPFKVSFNETSDSFSSWRKTKLIDEDDDNSVLKHPAFDDLEDYEGSAQHYFPTFPKHHGGILRLPWGKWLICVCVVMSVNRVYYLYISFLICTIWGVLYCEANAWSLERCLRKWMEEIIYNTVLLVLLIVALGSAFLVHTSFLIIWIEMYRPAVSYH